MIGRQGVLFDRARGLELHAAGRGWRQVAAALSVGVATVRRVLQLFSCVIRAQTMHQPADSYGADGR